MKKVLVLTICCVLFAVAAFAQADKTVSRHVFTSAIEDKEPVDTLTKVNAADLEKVFYFTELSNMQGTTVKHVWKVNDAVVYEKSFEVNGPRWRVYTSISSWHFKTGADVTASVVGDDGTVYVTDSIVAE